MDHQSSPAKARAIGINHIALEVGDIDAALAFYGKIFRFTLRGRGKGQAFIDMGDQFLALMETRTPHEDIVMDGTQRTCRSRAGRARSSPGRGDGFPLRTFRQAGQGAGAACGECR